VLGSGLGTLAGELRNPVVISYKDLPGFDECTVLGHEGNLYLGELHGVPIVCMQGRFHAYEGKSNTLLQTPIRTMKLLGCDTLLITNITGSLHPNLRPGDLTLISDHINFSFGNPLVGHNDLNFGPKFTPMGNAYDKDLRTHIKAAAKRLDIPLDESVYVGTLGPSFETAAEIRAFRLMGADVVGMSTVPEVIVARHCGLRVATISTISNMATGLAEEELNHELSLEWVSRSKENLVLLISASIATLYT